jgi:tyrosinase
VLNNVRVTPAGQYGGYYYEVFLNLPLNRNPANNPERYLVGSFGAFEVSTALHHGSPVRLVFPATQLLQNMSTEQIRQLTVSFVRVNGESAASGPAIVVGEMRVELSNREVE